MRYTWYIIAILSLNACNYIEHLNMSSEVVTKEYESDDIKQLVVNAACKITLTNANDNTITAEGQEHLVNDLIITNENNTLTIGHERKNYLQKKVN